MPNKIAEAQFFHTAEREGLPSLTLALNGDPIDGSALDHFVYEVHARFGQRRRSGPSSSPEPPGRRFVPVAPSPEPSLDGLSARAATRSGSTWGGPSSRHSTGHRPAASVITCRVGKGARVAPD
jgi:hypothetical protein